jgi:hypothetical protein
MEKPEGSECVDPEDSKTSEAKPTPGRAPRSDSGVPDDPPWRKVAAQAASETDPHRLTQLVEELIRLLDQERRPSQRKKPEIPQPGPEDS